MKLSISLAACFLCFSSLAWSAPDQAPLTSTTLAANGSGSTFVEVPNAKAGPAVTDKQRRPQWPVELMGALLIAAIATRRSGQLTD